jgi:hypothetical protein
LKSELREVGLIKQSLHRPWQEATPLQSLRVSEVPSDVKDRHLGGDFSSQTFDKQPHPCMENGKIYRGKKENYIENGLMEKIKDKVNHFSL